MAKQQQQHEKSPLLKNLFFTAYDTATKSFHFDSLSAEWHTEQNKRENEKIELVPRGRGERKKQRACYRQQWQNRNDEKKYTKKKEKGKFVMPLNQ